MWHYIEKAEISVVGWGCSWSKEESKAKDEGMFCYRKEMDKKLFQTFNFNYIEMKRVIQCQGS
jgi:hypothetical protein